jgi:hypothetical protein
MPKLLDPLTTFQDAAVYTSPLTILVAETEGFNACTLFSVVHL